MEMRCLQFEGRLLATQKQRISPFWPQRTQDFLIDGPEKGLCRRHCAKDENYIIRYFWSNIFIPKSCVATKYVECIRFLIADGPLPWPLSDVCIHESTGRAVRIGSNISIRILLMEMFGQPRSLGNVINENLSSCQNRIFGCSIQPKNVQYLNADAGHSWWNG